MIHLTCLPLNYCFSQRRKGPHAFEIVTPQKILHFMSESDEITSQWLTTIRSAISRCALDVNDPFVRSIAERIGVDEYYEVYFTESKPLGISISFLFFEKKS